MGYQVCVLSLAYAADLTKWILDFDDGNAEMKVVCDAIREGAEGFLTTQYGTIARWSVIVAGALFIIYLFRPLGGEAEGVSPFALAILTVLGFLLGAACSAMAGWVGVWVIHIPFDLHLKPQTNIPVIGVCPSERQSGRSRSST